MEEGTKAQRHEGTKGAGPNLRLPQRSPSATYGGRTKMWFVYVLLFIVIGLQTWGALREGNAAKPAQAVEASEATAGERAIAMRLEERNLPDAAADAWERYLKGAALDASDEAAIRYRSGKLLQHAERYQEAIGAFYRAEQLLGEHSSGELPRQITLRVRECLQKLGQYADLTREMAERADVSGDDTSLAGRQVVAEVEGDKITVADFDRMMTQRVEQMIAMQVGISDDEADAIRRQAHARFQDPQAKTEQLQQLVASRVLADESRKRGLQESEKFRRQLADFADRLLATNLMLEEVGRRATVTPQDVERYFAANRENYGEPTTVSIAHIVCATETEARDALAEAFGDIAFGDCAKRRSLDKATSGKDGVIPEHVSQEGDYVPGIGKNAELHAAIMNAPIDTILVNPYESDAGWHVVKVIDRTERVQKRFEDVRQAVEREVRAARRAEVTHQYIRELFEARGVKFYPGAFTQSGGDDGAGDR